MPASVLRLETVSFFPRGENLQHQRLGIHWTIQRRVHLGESLILVLQFRAVGSQRLHPDEQRALVDVRGLGVSFLIRQQRAQPVQIGGDFRMHRTHAAFA